MKKIAVLFVFFMAIGSTSGATKGCELTQFYPALTIIEKSSSMLFWYCPGTETLEVDGEFFDSDEQAFEVLGTFFQCIAEKQVKVLIAGYWIVPEKKGPRFVLHLSGKFASMVVLENNKRLRLKAGDVESLCGTAHCPGMEKYDLARRWEEEK